MRNDTNVFVGLDIHKDSIVAAYAIGTGEIQDLGNIGTLQRDLDASTRGLQSPVAPHASWSNSNARNGMPMLLALAHIDLHALAATILN